MKKLLFGVILLVSLIIAGIGIGCASMSEYVTPATINQRAVEFVVESGVGDPNEFKGWPNLHKALKLDSYVDMAFEVRYTILKQSIEDLQIDYNHLNDIVTQNLVDAQEREEELFADGGFLATALTAGGLGSFVGLLGLFKKRPGDMTKEDLQKAIEPIKGELGIKDQQFAQVVTGFERFMQHRDEITSVLSKDTDAAEKTDTLLKLMKTYLGRAQDASTQQEVAKVRATV